MCLAADKDDQGGPLFIVEDLPPKGPPDLTVFRPEIYYGTEMTSYQIVPTGVRSSTPGRSERLQQLHRPWRRAAG